MYLLTLQQMSDINTDVSIMITTSLKDVIIKNDNDTFILNKQRMTRFTSHPYV